MTRLETAQLPFLFSGTSAIVVGRIGAGPEGTHERGPLGSTVSSRPASVLSGGTCGKYSDTMAKPQRRGG
jgi:hypothetical protein